MCVFPLCLGRLGVLALFLKEGKFDKKKAVIFLNALSKIVIGDGALVGAYSLLVSGVRVSEKEVVPPLLPFMPFTSWENGRRKKIKKDGVE